MIKVLIVEDSISVIKYLNYIFSNCHEIQVIGSVRNGKEALEFLENEKPDIITMDIDMPVMNGLEATRRIMCTNPVPIIIVTASRNAKELSNTMEALAAGALSVIEKPVGIGHLQEKEKTENLIRMVKVLSEVKVIKRRHKPEDKTTKDFTSVAKPLNIDNNNIKIVGVGVSAGGPNVLKKIFSGITWKFPYPIVVVQHITGGFLESMAEWLGNQLMIPVRIATQDEKILPGHIYFAPEDHQMGVLKTFRIILEKNNEQYGYCPSVAHLFKTIAQEFEKHALAMILTGMGSDGAEELKMLRDTGSVTIAQDYESSIVYGMPGAAIKLDAVDHILSIDEIAETLKKIEMNFYKI